MPYEMSCHVCVCLYFLVETRGGGLERFGLGVDIELMLLKQTTLI